MNPPAPHILLVGHGTIATMLGIALQATEAEVWHLTHEDASPMPIQLAFRDRRMTTFHYSQPTYTYRVLPDRGEIGEFDWIVLTVGHHDLPVLMAEIGPLLTPQQHLLTMGNIWEDYELLDRYAPGQYLLGFPHFGGVLADGKLEGWLTERISLGEPDGRMSERAGEMQQILFEAGFSPEIKPDLRDWLAVHFAWTSGLMTAVAEAGSYEALSHKWNTLIRAYRHVREAMQLVESHGVPIRKFREGRKAFRPLWVNAGLSWLMLHAPGFARRMDRAPKPREWASYRRVLKEVKQQVQKEQQGQAPAMAQ